MIHEALRLCEEIDCGDTAERNCEDENCEDEKASNCGDEQAAQPWTGADNYLAASECEDIRLGRGTTPDGSLRGSERRLNDEHLLGDVKMPGDDVIPKCAELATQPCIEADNCDMVHDFEDRRLRGEFQVI